MVRLGSDNLEHRWVKNLGDRKTQAFSMLEYLRVVGPFRLIKIFDKIQSAFSLTTKKYFLLLLLVHRLSGNEFVFMQHSM